MARRTWVVACGLLAAGAGWRRYTTPFPYSLRRMLDEEFPSLKVDGLLGILEPLPGDHVLEVGPGTGLFSLPVARTLGADGRLTIFDIQQAMIDHTLMRAEADHLTNVDGQRGDACALPFPDGCFDRAFLVTVLGETRDRQACLNELSRVLRPGGRLVVGEFMVDWHAVRFPSLVRRAARAGLSFERRAGSRIGYFARFSKGSLPLEAAPASIAS